MGLDITVENGKQTLMPPLIGWACLLLQNSCQEERDGGEGPPGRRECQVPGPYLKSNVGNNNASKGGCGATSYIPNTGGGGRGLRV